MFSTFNLVHIRVSMFATLLVALAHICLVGGDVVIGISEASAIQCGQSMNNAVCVQCPVATNMSLPANFFSTAIPCTKWPHFSDNSLAYASQSTSATLSLYFSDVDPPVCTPNNFITSITIPSQNTCGSAATYSFSIVSTFDQLGNETRVEFPTLLPTCGQWINSGNQLKNSCPLENASSFYCNNLTTTNGFVAALGLNVTVYNLCTPTCISQYNTQCLTNSEQCYKLAQTVMTTNPQVGNELMCGCAQALFACQYASGCYPQGEGLTAAYSTAAHYCDASAPLTVTIGTSSSCSTTPVSVSCTSSDFGGSFGGAILGTFLIHALTALAFYARKRMGPQSINVSNRPVTAEETAIVNS